MKVAVSGADKVRRVGILGGSFNPAHGGHLHITRQALDHLNLDQVWWLVSPQNPLKAAAGMASLAERMAEADRVAADMRIRVTGLERDLGTRYTVDTLRVLKQRFPHIRFVWIMGADLLMEVPRWKDWRDLFRSVSVAVFARPTYFSRALSSHAARRFARHRVPAAMARGLADRRPPAWAFFRTRVNAASATKIRARQDKAGDGRAARQERRGT